MTATAWCSIISLVCAFSHCRYSWHISPSSLKASLISRTRILTDKKREKTQGVNAKQSIQRVAPPPVSLEPSGAVGPRTVLFKKQFPRLFKNSFPGWDSTPQPPQHCFLDRVLYHWATRATWQAGIYYVHYNGKTPASIIYHLICGSRVCFKRWANWGCTYIPLSSKVIYWQME